MSETHSATDLFVPDHLTRSAWENLPGKLEGILKIIHFHGRAISHVKFLDFVESQWLLVGTGLCWFCWIALRY